MCDTQTPTPRDQYPGRLTTLWNVIVNTWFNMIFYFNSYRFV